jgi:hypothetical protein
MEKANTRGTVGATGVVVACLEIGCRHHYDRALGGNLHLIRSPLLARADEVIE